MKKRLLIALLVIASLLSACSTVAPPAEDTGTTVVPTEEVTDPFTNDLPAVEKMHLVQNGSTEYSIQLCPSNETEIYFASELRELLGSCLDSGVMPLRILASQETPSGSSQILVGEVARPYVNDQLEDGCFSVSVDEGRVALYAKDKLGYLGLLQHLRSALEESLSDKSLFLPLGEVTGRLASTLHNEKDATLHFIYDPREENATFTAMLLAARITADFGIATKVHTVDGDYPNKVYLGRSDSETPQKVSSLLKKGEYFVGVVDGSVVMQSDSQLGLFFGYSRLLECLGQMKNGAEEVTLEARLESYANAPRNEAYAEVVALANSYMGTYSSYADRNIVISASEDVKADHALVNALKTRLGNSLVVQIGNCLALHNGYVHRLGPWDHKLKAKVVNGHVLVPRSYAEVYFGKTLSADAEGYVDLTAICEQESGYSLYLHSTTGIAVVLPAGVADFRDLVAEIGGYRNVDYLVKILHFLNNPYLPEPQNSVQSTRIVVGDVGRDQDCQYFFDYVYGEKEENTQCLYTPAILAVEENGKQVIYVSYEHVYHKNTYTGTSGYTVALLKRSEDQGKTWTLLDETRGLYHQSLFELKGKIYTIGSMGGRFYLVQYDPATGKTAKKDFGVAVGNGSSNTVLHANGRVYRSFNEAIVSIPEDADPMVLENWTFSNSPQPLVTREAFTAATGLTAYETSKFWVEEGNVVQAPSGQLYVMFRLNAPPTLGYVVLFKLSADGTVITLDDDSSGYLEFPYTQSKFSLIYDAELGLYISLTSLSTYGNITSQRNCLGLVVSRDLYHWEVLDTLVVDRQMVTERYSIWAHGFQYVDFSIGGDDLYFFVREAADQSFNYHDANYMTMYTIEGFRAFITERIPAGI